MQNNHLTEEELQTIAEGKQAGENQIKHLSECKKCSDSLKLYQMITSSLYIAPEYNTSHLTSESIIKKLDNRRFSFLFSSKIDIYFIVFLFIAAVAASFIFTDLIPSLKSIDLSIILKVFTENEFIKNTVDVLSTYIQIFIYIPFIILTLFITLFFEKIVNTQKHKITNT